MQKSLRPLLKRQKARKKRPAGQRSVVPLFAAVTVLIGSLLFLVWCRLQITHMGYRISQASQEQAQLLELKKELEIEGDSLRSLARIETVARKQLGLLTPQPEQMVFIK